MFGKMRLKDAESRIDDLLEDVSARHAGLIVSFREDDDEFHGGSFRIDADGRRELIVDLRQLRNDSVFGCADVSDYAYSVLEIFHEEQHICQYEDLFRQDSDDARRQARYALIGRVFPEYRDAVYCRSPVERYAERNGLLVAYEYLSEEAVDLKFDVDAVLTGIINSAPAWYSERRPVRNVLDAIKILDAEMAIKDYGADLSAPYIRRKGGPSEFCNLLREDPDMRRRYERVEPNRNNELEQQMMVMAWIRRHPVRDISLFPCLKDYFDKPVAVVRDVGLGLSGDGPDTGLDLR